MNRMQNGGSRRIALIQAAFCALPLLFALGGCGSDKPIVDTQAQTVSSASASPVSSSAPALQTPSVPETPQPANLQNGSGQKSPARPPFDADAAFKLLTKQCDFGPRPLGSAAHEKTKKFLLAEMKQYADDTFEQKFTYRGMPVTNVVGVFYPTGMTAPAKNPVLLLTHWDSRPVADGPFSTEIGKSPTFQYGPNGWNRMTPIVAANDGASGTAVLLQLARMFKQHKPSVGVVLLLDDGEDYGDFRANGGQGEGVELGSRYFAKHFREDKRFGYPDYGILLDMVGGKNLLLPVEKFSMQYAPGTMTKVYQAAQTLGYKDVFRTDLDFAVEDDHIALNRAGMHVIDLIPYFGDSAPAGTTGYTHWHTLEDTPDKCDAASLKIVGETIAEVVYGETPAP